MNRRPVKLPAFERLSPRSISAAVLLLVVGIAYGSLGESAFVSDDFLYLEAASRGLGPLLETVSTASYPRMLRPWPALFWPLGLAAHGAAVLHALSLLLHLGSGILLARFLEKVGQRTPESTLIAATFLCLPLLGETVAWLSASFDLWATTFSLATLLAAAHGRWAHATLFLLLALLSKESALTVPFMVWILLPGIGRRMLLSFGGVTLVYGAFRAALLGGIGGYVEPVEHGIVLLADLESFARTLLLALPSALLHPLTDRPEWLPWTALASAVAGFLVMSSWSRPVGRKVSELALIAALGLIPVVPVLGLSSDSSGGRFFYLPTAFLCATAGRWTVRHPRRFRIALCSLLVAWSVCLQIRTRSWLEASSTVDSILRSALAAEEDLPRGARVLVDAPDMVRGAYVFRVGLPQAIALRSSRSDLRWQRGSISLLKGEHLLSLGTSIFLLEQDDSGALVDTTACWRAEVPRRRAMEGTSVAFHRLGPRRIQTVLPPDVDYVELSAGSCDALLRGLVFTKAFAHRFFTMSAARTLLLHPGDCRSLIPLEPDHSDLRLDFDRAVDFEELRLRTVPAPVLQECRDSLRHRNETR